MAFECVFFFFPLFLFYVCICIQVYVFFATCGSYVFGLQFVSLPTALFHGLHSWCRCFETTLSLCYFIYLFAMRAFDKRVLTDSFLFRKHKLKWGFELGLHKILYVKSVCQDDE